VNLLLRTLIVWLVLLAVPFQGVASAAMMACAPAPAQPSQAMQHVAKPAHHGQACKQSTHQTKCDHCAACWAGAAIATSLVATFTPQPAATIAMRADPGQPPSVDLEDPEPPPRFAHA
jgi:hypothetical protein